MDLSHFQLIGGIVGAMAAAGLPAYLAIQRAAQAAAKEAASVSAQISPPNGNEHDHRTIRQMLADLMHQVTALDDRLRLHDDRQQENARRIGRIEKLVEHQQKGKL